MVDFEPSIMVAALFERADFGDFKHFSLNLKSCILLGGGKNLGKEWPRFLSW